MEGIKTKGEERKTDLSLLLKRPSNMPRYAVSKRLWMRT